MAHDFDSVLRSVHSQSLNLRKYNREPKALYVGYNEYDVLRTHARFTFYMPSPFTACVEKFDGLLVHRVNEPNHIKVTD